MILSNGAIITIFIFSLLTIIPGSVVGYVPSKYPTMVPTNFPGNKPSVSPTTFHPWGKCNSVYCTSLGDTCCGNSTVANCYGGTNDVCCTYEFACSSSSVCCYNKFCCPSSEPVCCNDGCCKSGYTCTGTLCAIISSSSPSQFSTMHPTTPTSEPTMRPTTPTCEPTMTPTTPSFVPTVNPTAAPTFCPLGYVLQSEDSSACIACPINTYSANNICVHCSTGFVTGNVASTGKDSCINPATNFVFGMLSLPLL